MPDEFKVAFFSDPPIVSRVIGPLLNSKIPIACAVSIIPRTTQHDLIDDIKKLFVDRGIPFFRPESMKSPEFQEEVLKTKPTVVAAMSLMTKIPKELLNKVPLGGINWHPALLPQYRGAVPYFWVIRNQEPVTGATIHVMTDKFDAGDIHFSEPIVIDPVDTTGTLSVKCAEVGIKLMLRALNDLRAGKALPRIPQDETKVSYAPVPTAQVLTIDWSRPSRQILALIRAASPFHGASTLFSGLPLRIWSAVPSRKNHENKEPGTVSVSRGLMEVATGDDFISLETMQLELIRFFSGREFLTIPGVQEGLILR